MLTFLLLAAVGAAAAFVHPAASLAVFAGMLGLAVKRWRLSNAGVLGVLFVGMLLFSANYRLAAPLPVDMTADRIALLVILVAWLLGMLDVRDGWPDEARSINRPLAWLFGISALTLLANAPALAPSGLLMTGAKRLLTLGQLVLVYSMVVALVRSREDIERVVRLLVGVGTIAAASGIVEGLTRSNPLRQLQTALPFEQHQVTEVMARGSGIRAYGTAGHPIEFGAMMSMLLPLAVYLLLNTKERSARLVWGAATALITVAMLFSISRSSILAAGAGLVVMALLSRRRAALFGYAAIALVGINLVFPDLLDTLRTVLDPKWILEQEQAAWGGRMKDWPRVWAIIRTSPVVGVGLSLLDPVRYGFYLDNQYLRFLAEIGAFGLAAVFWLFGVILTSLSRLALRTRHAENVSLASALLAAVVSYVLLSALFDTFGFFQVTDLFFVIVGLAVVLIHREVTAPVQGGAA
jgi:O-antigen ligase